MPALNLEHIAVNVSDAVAVAAWYVEHLGMQVVRKVTVAPATRDVWPGEFPHMQGFPCRSPWCWDDGAAQLPPGTQ